jgi:putative sterol carrier protein
MDFILAATPQEWKKLLRRESKFLTNFMLGKVTLEHGSRVAMLSLVPYTDTVMDLLTEVDLQFQDEMSSEEVAAYREELQQFRAEHGV